MASPKLQLGHSHHLKKEEILINAGYAKICTAQAQGNRIKSWWTHSTYRRIEVIYSPDLATAITAYHP